MKREITHCDRCGDQTDDENESIAVKTGRSMDASGNGYEDDLEYIDLCPKCMRKWINITLKQVSFQKFLTFVKEEQK